MRRNCGTVTELSRGDQAFEPDTIRHTCTWIPTSWYPHASDLIHQPSERSLDEVTHRDGALFRLPEVTIEQELRRVAQAAGQTAPRQVGRVRIVHSVSNREPRSHQILGRVGHEERAPARGAVTERNVSAPAVARPSRRRVVALIRRRRPLHHAGRVPRRWT